MARLKAWSREQNKSLGELLDGMLADLDPPVALGDPPADPGDPPATS